MSKQSLIAKIGIMLTSSATAVFSGCASLQKDNLDNQPQIQASTSIRTGANHLTAGPFFDFPSYIHDSSVSIEQGNLKATAGTVNYHTNKGQMVELDHYIKGQVDLENLTTSASIYDWNLHGDHNTVIGTDIKTKGKLNVGVCTLFSPENGGYVIIPKASYQLTDNLSFNTGTAYADDFIKKANDWRKVYGIVDVNLGKIGFLDISASGGYAHGLSPEVKSGIIGNIKVEVKIPKMPLRIRKKNPKTLKTP